ncbi:MAG: ABC transporter substrate-binding protein [Rhodobacteraceae bacterium]|nr:ABC transporter substrate-binding protein [Paracoccaceae bacterium]
MASDLPLLRPTRRAVLGGIGASAALFAAPAFALNVSEARALIQSLVGEINTVIASSATEQQMYAQFERIFNQYADVPVIAQSALGPPARTATPAQMAAYVEAFRGYIARKYGSRFREFIGGRIEVEEARPLRSFYEVITTAYLRGESPFEVRFHVSDRSGRNLFFNMMIEGVNMIATERTEIGAMLDRRRGNLDQLIADIRRAG